MERHSYADMEALQATNWWYVAKRELIKRLIEKTHRVFSRVLDMGCGVGSNASALLAPGRDVVGLDASDDALERCRRTGMYRELIRSEAENIPLPDSSLDLILAADVLEHVDDERALAEIHRTLSPGGLLLVTVPAHRWLWNWNDDYSHHLRRYAKRELMDRLSQAGFRVRKMSYWNAFSVLPVLVVSRLQRMKPKPEQLENNLNSVPGPLNSFFLMLLRLENAFVLRTGIPFGVSLVAAQ
ncbi:MAG: methyltransferase domain-containing protein, partial [Patescibacteria group bacterium]